MKYLIALAALAAIAACDTAAPVPVSPGPDLSPPVEADCDQPGQRDEQGRPIPQC